MIPFVAVPMKNQNKLLADKELIHITLSERLPGIIDTSSRQPIPEYATHNIHLVAGQGWSFSGRFMRDYSVLDPYLNHAKAYGCYTYFFIGPPSKWALLKNIGWNSSKGDLTGKAVLRVTGQDMLRNSELFFHRIDDNVLVIRGDYKGPAIIEDYA